MFTWVRRIRIRRAVLAGLLLAALLGGVAGVRHFRPVSPGVNPANCRKIGIGMPRAEVENLLGGPPVDSEPIWGDAVSAYRPIFPDWGKPYPDGPPYPVWFYRVWGNNRCVIEVIFDDQSRVVARRCVEDTYVTRTRRWLADQRDAIWKETPKARVERLLRSCPSLQEDPQFSPGELLDYVHYRYDIEFRIDPTDFGVQDAQELLQQRVGLEASANKDLRANLDELLGKVKATYVVEDGYIRIVPAPPK